MGDGRRWWSRPCLGSYGPVCGRATGREPRGGARTRFWRCQERPHGRGSRGLRQAIRSAQARRWTGPRGKGHRLRWWRGCVAKRVAGRGPGSDSAHDGRREARGFGDASEMFGHTKDGGAEVLCRLCAGRRWSRCGPSGCAAVRGGEGLAPYRRGGVARANRRWIFFCGARASGASLERALRFPKQAFLGWIAHLAAPPELDERVHKAAMARLKFLVSRRTRFPR